MPSLHFSSGTLELRGLEADADLPPGWTWDARTACFRAPAVHYAPVVRALVQRGVELEDLARSYEELDLKWVEERTPRPFQAEALRAWRKGRCRGVVVLPTGAGKSHVALLAIADRQRSTLVVAPTLDLVRQWYDLLRTSFGIEVGVIGGGEYDLKSVTVTTYDSAYAHMEHLGARFGLIVFDECHHLPSESYGLAAKLCLAPFRLGLTATPERSDGRDEELGELIGPILYRRDIRDLSGEYLAEYETRRIAVALSEAERAEYDAERAVYLAYVRQQGIRMSSPRGFSEFVQRASRTAAGQRALAAYRRQRELALAAQGKLAHLAELLSRHSRDRMLIFTQDNATAYDISRRFLLPIITHQTKVRERSEILEGFAAGRYGAIVTSKVLNEGVDVPDANVAVVISGSGSVREHVQRLGRILRRKGDKSAVLYELVSVGTTETHTSERRREHDAYRVRRN